MATYDPARRLREPRLLTEAQAAEILGVSPKTMQRMRKENTAPAYVKIGRQIRYTPAAISKFINANQVGR